MFTTCGLSMTIGSLELVCPPPTGYNQERHPKGCLFWVLNGAESVLSRDGSNEPPPSATVPFATWSISPPFWVFMQSGDPFNGLPVLGLKGGDCQKIPMAPMTTPKRMASGVMPKRTTPHTASLWPRRLRFLVRISPSVENASPSNQSKGISPLAESMRSKANVPNAKPVMDAQS